MSDKHERQMTQQEREIGAAIQAVIAAIRLFNRNDINWQRAAEVLEPLASADDKARTEFFGNLSKLRDQPAAPSVLRLPEMWSSRCHLFSDGWVVDIYDGSGRHRGWWKDDDKAAAIQAAQAAVDAVRGSQ